MQRGGLRRGAHLAALLLELARERLDLLRSGVLLVRLGPQIRDATLRALNRRERILLFALRPAALEGRALHRQSLVCLALRTVSLRPSAPRSTHPLRGH